MHRKIWEYCYIAQALFERGMLAPGRRGLGFAVGQEPLSALFASMGCEVLATDLAPTEADAALWKSTGQHAASLDALNSRGICPADVFLRNTRFRYLDMRELPDGFGTFDFVWSSCAAEHLGSLVLGRRFLIDSVKYLRPGGVCVHTVEYNVRSNCRTLAHGPTVLFRKHDLRRVAQELGQRHCHIGLDFRLGRLPADRFVDGPPYPQETHLKLALAGYTASSFGLIIECPSEPL